MQWKSWRVAIVTDVIGVDMKQDHLLASIAHSYRRADDPISLRSALQDILAEVTGPGTDATEDEAFPLLQGLPDGASERILTALHNDEKYTDWWKVCTRVQCRNPSADHDAFAVRKELYLQRLYVVLRGGGSWHWDQDADGIGP